MLTKARTGGSMSKNKSSRVQRGKAEESTEGSSWRRAVSFSSHRTLSGLRQHQIYMETA